VSKRLITALAVVVALAGMAAGCGDSGEEPLTKAEFVKQADAICETHDQELEAELTAYGEEKARPGQDKGTEFTKTVLLPSIESEIEEISELSPPEADAQQVSAMLSAMQAGADRATAEPEKILSFESNPLLKSKKLAVAYGLEVCGRT